MEPTPTLVTSFILFPNLPSEIRLKIWRALFAPRTVGIQSTIGGHTLIGWRTLDPPPLVLQISHESREEALKHYKLSFGTPLEPARIYFNFRIDTLRFGKGYGEDFLTDPQWTDQGPGSYLLTVFLGTAYSGKLGPRPVATGAEHLRYLTIDIDDDIYDRRSFCWAEIRRFEHLKELTLLIWEEDTRSAELMARFQSVLDNVMEEHHEWKIPTITVFSAFTRNKWGHLKQEHIERFEA